MQVESGSGKIIMDPQHCCKVWFRETSRNASQSTSGSGIYFGPTIIFTVFLCPFRKWYFPPSCDTSFFDSFRTLFALILPYVAFILPFFFPFSLFLPLSFFSFPLFLFLFLFLYPFSFSFSFYLFLLNFPPFFSFPFIFFPSNDIGWNPPEWGWGVRLPQAAVQLGEDEVARREKSNCCGEELSIGIFTSFAWRPRENWWVVSVLQFI